MLSHPSPAPNKGYSVGISSKCRPTSKITGCKNCRLFKDLLIFRCCLCKWSSQDLTVRWINYWIFLANVRLRPLGPSYKSYELRGLGCFQQEKNIYLGNLAYYFNQKIITDHRLKKKFLLKLNHVNHPAKTLLVKKINDRSFIKSFFSQTACYTVKLRLTATLVIRWPRYLYGHFFGTLVTVLTGFNCTVFIFYLGGGGWGGTLAAFAATLVFCSSDWYFAWCSFQTWWANNFNQKSRLATTLARVLSYAECS